MTRGAHVKGGDKLAIHIRRCIVRTNIVLDDKLIREAMKLADVRTMREAVDVALRRFVHSGKQRRLLELKATGGVRKDYDYKRARSGG
jgi:Arc/MetJ family transcription regulator